MSEQTEHALSHDFSYTSLSFINLILRSSGVTPHIFVVALRSFNGTLKAFLTLRTFAVCDLTEIRCQSAALMNDDSRHLLRYNIAKNIRMDIISYSVNFLILLLNLKNNLNKITYPQKNKECEKRRRHFLSI